MSPEVHQSASALSGSPNTRENGQWRRLNKTRNYTKTTSWSKEEKKIIYINASVKISNASLYRKCKESPLPLAVCRDLSLNLPPLFTFWYSVTCRYP